MPLPAIFNNPKGHQTVIDGTGKLDVGEYELQLFDSRYMIKEEQPKRFTGWLKPSCIPITIILVLIFLVVLLPLLESRQEPPAEPLVSFEYHKLWKNCSSPCVFTLIETLPTSFLSFNYHHQHQTIFKGWLELIGLARNNIFVATSDFQLLEDQGTDRLFKDYEKWEGKDIYQQLKDFGVQEGVQLQIVTNEKNESREIEELINAGAADIRFLDMTTLTGMTSLLRSNMIIVDQRHFYLGSAPLRWKSLFKTKELGILAFNCSCLAHDLKKIFDVYWLLSAENRTTVPIKWPYKTHTAINRSNPVIVELNETSSNTYFTSSPPVLSSTGRSSNLETILDTINRANNYVYISTNDYFPIAQINQNTTTGYWSKIDDALRKASINKKLDVRILTAQCFNSTNPIRRMDFLNSLVALNVSVKLFMVEEHVDAENRPVWTEQNHYILTEERVYFGTSSWSGNSLLHDASVGIFVDQSDANGGGGFVPIREQFGQLFLRDWNSKFARSIKLTNVLDLER